MGKGRACPKIGPQDLLAIQGSWNLDSGDPRQLGPAKTQLTLLPLVPGATAVFSQPAADMVRLLLAPSGVPGGLAWGWSGSWEPCSGERTGRGFQAQAPEGVGASLGIKGAVPQGWRERKEPAADATVCRSAGPGMGAPF